MPPKKAAAAAKPASTKTKTPAKSILPPKLTRTSSRKPSTVSPPARSAPAKSTASKRKASAEEPEEQPMAKKSKASTTQPTSTSTKHSKEAPKTKTSKAAAAAKPKATLAQPNGTKSRASVAKPKVTPAKVNGTKSKASIIATKSTTIKRKAADHLDDVEAPKSKKSKTTAVASEPAAKATTSKTKPRKIAIPRKTAATTKKVAPKAADKPAAAEPKTAPKKGSATKTDWNKLKAVDLKAELKQRGLAQTGVKAVLVARLAASENEDGSSKTAASKPASKNTTKKAPVAKKAAPAVKPAPKRAANPKKPAKPAKVLPTINQPPTQRIDVFVFGEGSAGELGLGAKGSNGRKVIDVVRPRLNARLSAKDVGVVQIAVGGMHCAALTYDNKILTWGVNDGGALGRDTDEGPMKEIVEGDSSDSDSDDEDSGLNASEAEPREVDPKYFPEGTKFASLYAGDSTTFALTTTGKVYGWGTFRGNEGVVGFRPEIKEKQLTPMLIPELQNIVDMACGTNHVLALDIKGKLYVWGTGEQNQLGRRVIQRTSRLALKPTEIGLKGRKIMTIGSGDYNSFAIDNKGNVLSWGLNSFGQTGIPKEGENVDVVGSPTLVKSLNGIKLKQITSGSHHTIACTENGQVLVWGRVENSEGGMDLSQMSDEVVYRENGRARYLKKPTVVPDIEGACVATANDTNLVITTQGTAYSWGFSENYQTGQGTGEDVKMATLIDNTAVRGKKLIWGGVGGQFGMLGGVPEEITTNSI